MAASTRLRLNQQATGSGLNVWGEKLNDEVIALLDEAVQGLETVALTGSNRTLSSTNFASDEARNFGLLFTGTGGVSVIYPSVECVKVVINASSAAIVFGYSAGSGVTVAAGSGAVVAGNATTMYEVARIPTAADLSALFQATSTDTETIASSGDITFTLAETNRAFAPGMLIRAAVTASPGTNYVDGYVKSYSGTTLVMTATSSGGSGSYSAWTITFNQATVGLPDQTGNSGEFLTTDGAVASWSSISDTARSWTRAQRGTPVTLTDAATVAVDFSLSNNFDLTLGGSRTLGNPTNQVAGQGGRIYIKQDATGSRTLSYSSNWKFPSGSAPVLSTAANAKDCLFYEVLESGVILASLAKGIA